MDAADPMFEPIGAPLAACAGKWELFDSTDFFDHRQARRICISCPLIEQCRATLRDTRARALDAANGPRGTWAGELVGSAVPNAHRLAAEEAMFNEVEAKAAHAKWAHTPASLRDTLPDRIALGERVYQRRTKRNATARREVA